MTHQLASITHALSWGATILVLAGVGYWGLEHSDDRPALIRRWIYTALLLLIDFGILSMDTPMKLLLFILPLVPLAFIWLPSTVSKFMGPLTGAFDGGGEEVEPRPYYFKAEGKRRRGLFDEAIVEVQKQLEMFPGDYEGYLKLASIQMENLNNLPAAEATLNEFVGLPDRAPNDLINALHQLADWQLKFGRDAKAASATLQRIVTLYPGTPPAHAAEQRIAHLVTADETSRERYERKFTVTPRERDIGLRQESAPAVAPPDPHARAAELVKQLESHPSDTDSREKLAILYAEDFQRLDLAVDQLEQLISLPAEPPKHVARWLNLLATLHIKCAHNIEAAEAALRRIPQKFPGGALAEVATHRLAALEGELKANKPPPSKIIGNYEKNLGLKKTGVI